MSTEKKQSRVNIVSTNSIILPRLDKYGRPETWGVLADVEGHGRVGRWETHPHVGETCYGYARIAPDPAVEPEILATPKSEVDEVERALEEARLGPRKRLARFGATALEAEVARFRAEYPILAERLGVATQRPEQVIQTGPSWYPQVGSPEDAATIGLVDWAGLLARHGSGDFGDHGRLDPSALDDEVKLFLVGLQDQAFRNAHYLKTGWGVVRSRYGIDDVLPGAVVHASTALKGGTPRTLMQIELPAAARFPAKSRVR